MTLRPFFSYFGSKWRDAPMYPRPVHATVCEPFAGSAGYSLRHYRRNVVLCDVDPYVVGVWQYLLRVDPEEISALPDLGEGQTVTDLKVPQEAQWLIGFWCGHGIEQPRRRLCGWAQAKPVSFWGPRIRSRLARQVPMIRHWQIHYCDYREAPVRRSTWFIAPPYMRAGRRYRFGPRGLDYNELGAWCQAREGRVIVCENEGAMWLPFGYPRDAAATRGTSREVLYFQETP